MYRTIRTAAVALAAAATIATAIAPAGAQAKPNTGTNKGWHAGKALCMSLKGEYDGAVGRAIDAANANDDATMEAEAGYGNAVRGLAKDSGCAWAW
jgi:hypothetical protein